MADTISIRCVPIRREYACNTGLSERYFRRVLEKQGWLVWRGGSIDMLRRDELYPNVRRKYGKLISLLSLHHPDKLQLLQYWCAVHHGMPDFICYRKGRFKFVECKFKHEQLSKRQKLCIQKLQALGFKVEVLKFVDPSTRTIRARINYKTKEKIILEKQKPIFAFAP